MIHYVESSAAVKLIVEEDHSAALADALRDVLTSGGQPVSSYLLETELRRVISQAGLQQTLAGPVLDGFDLVLPDRAIFTQAGLLPGEHLRSLDAIHIATAIRVSADLFITYDQRQAEAAGQVGLAVCSPGA